MALTSDRLQATFIPEKSPRDEIIQSHHPAETHSTTDSFAGLDVIAIVGPSPDPNKLRWKQGVFGRTWAFHAVNIAFQAVWLITPLSVGLFAFSLYIIITQRAVTPLPMIALLLSAAEMASAIYQRYLIRKIRLSPSICTMTAYEQGKFGRQIFHSDLHSAGTTRAPRGDLEVSERGVLLNPRAETGNYGCLSTCCSGDVTHDLSERGLQRAMAFRHRYSIWFHNAAWGDLRRTDILIWLSSLFLNLPLNQALKDREAMALVYQMYIIIEARSATTFPSGRNPLVKVIQIPLDPINAIPRPLLIYAISNTINFAIRTTYLALRGMTLYRQGDIDYLIRIPPGWTPGAGRSDPNAMPVTYLHGMGFGLLQNIVVIRSMLEKLSTHPIIYPIAHHTGQSFLRRGHLKPWTRKQFVRDVRAICAKWGFGGGGGEGCERNDEKPLGGLSVFSHSNGSVYHGWMLKDCPLLIRRNTLVDPIIFGLENGLTTHSFCYQVPTTPFQLIIQRLVSSELGTSNYIQRHFHWTENGTFLKDHPQLLDPTITRYFLGGKDSIVDAVRLKEYLRKHGVEVGVGVVWDAEGIHGSALKGENLSQVIDFVGSSFIA